MGTVKLPFQNPHVTLVNDEVLQIRHRSKRLKIALSNICKIYLSKRKTGYLSAFLGNLHITRSSGFKLFVHTKDNNLYTIDIPIDEKYQFVNLIAWVRKQIRERESLAKQRLQQKVAATTGQAVAA